MLILFHNKFVYVLCDNNAVSKIVCCVVSLKTYDHKFPQRTSSRKNPSALPNFCTFGHSTNFVYCVE